MITVPELLIRAKCAIESGETSLQAAAEDMAAAQKQGATQRLIAESVGKSPAWVNRLLRWRQRGYQEATAFGPQAKASRQRTKARPVSSGRAFRRMRLAESQGFEPWIRFNAAYTISSRAP